METTTQFEQAIAGIDAYNAADPNKVDGHGEPLAKELLYAVRMTEALATFKPDASIALRLAARCQHIGRWEIPRKDFPMDRKGYLQWRSKLKLHHSELAGKILADAGYGEATIGRVQFLVMKKQLGSDAETQTLEDVVCLVFLRHYLEAFASEHEEEKVVEILKKTMKKMSPEAIATARAMELPRTVRHLMELAA